MHAYEGPQLTKMFESFADSESSRLNRGVRGRLVEHCKFLVREKKIKGYDAHAIFEATKELPYEEEYKNTGSVAYEE